MAQANLAFALAGLGGFNAHGAGFLAAARDKNVVPDLITATSGQIAVLAAYLNGESDLKTHLVDPKIESNPFAQINILLFGYPDVFAPAWTEAVKRLVQPPWIGFDFDFYANRLLPAQVYKPTRSAQTIAALRDTFNKHTIGVIFNSYDPVTGEGALYGNDAARALMNPKTHLDVPPDQTSADMHFDKPAGEEKPILPITSEAIEAALWLTLYGFEGYPKDGMDGAYHRSCILSELHGFDRVYVCRPLANGWCRNELPKSYFDVQDWNTEMWFSVGYKAESDAMKRINALVAKGKVSDPDYKYVDLVEVEPETPAGYFNFFVERDAVYERAYAKSCSIFDWVANGKVGPKP